MFVVKFLDIKKIFICSLFLMLLATSIYPNIYAKNISINSEKDFKTDDIYDLLIITPKEFKFFLKPLVNHKIHYGIKTKLVTLDEIYSKSIWGRDNSEKIKYVIKEAYDDFGIDYVLLVGSYKKLPVRYIYNSDFAYESYIEESYISDLYYADLYDNDSSFQTWDYDGDGIFGEWTVNETNARDKYIDLYPDISIGRLACRNLFEVIIMVDKIIKYETQTYGSDWFKNFVTVAGDTYPEGEYPFETSPIEGEVDSEKVIKNMTGFNPIRLFVSNGNFTGPDDVINIINSGCGVMFFSGHASPLSWGTHPVNSTEFIFGLKNKDFWKLRNFYKLPVVIAGACHNAQIDVTPFNFLKNPVDTFKHYTYPVECWAWKFVSKPLGGAISVIANTGLGMSKEDKKSLEGAGDFMDVQFFDIYGDGESDILGECWAKCIKRYIDNYPIDWEISDSSEYVYDEKYDLKTAQQFILLGDPSLKIGGYEN